MPPGMMARGFADEMPPEGIPVAMGVLRHGPIEPADDEPKTTRGTRGQGGLLDERGNPRDPEDEPGVARVSDLPPSLPNINSGGSIHLPSRLHSRANRHPTEKDALAYDLEDLPDIPRKSSRRHSGITDHSPTPSFNHVPPAGSAAVQDGRREGDTSREQPSSSDSVSVAARLPFERSNSQKRVSSTTSIDAGDDFTQADLRESGREERPTSYGFVPQHSISRVDPDHRHHIDLLGSSAEVVDERRRSNTSSRDGGHY